MELPSNTVSDQRHHLREKFDDINTRWVIIEALTVIPFSCVRRPRVSHQYHQRKHPSDGRHAVRAIHQCQLGGRLQGPRHHSSFVRPWQRGTRVRPGQTGFYQVQFTPECGTVFHTRIEVLPI